MKILFIALFISTFLSCSRKPEEIENVQTNQNTASETTCIKTEILKDSLEGISNKIIPVAPALVTHKYSNSNFSDLSEELKCIENIGGIMLGQEINDVLMTLGKPSHIEDEVFWEVDGLFHTLWSYEALGLSVEFIRTENDNGSTVQVITIDKKLLATSKGISVGAHRNTVLNKYLEEITTEGNEIMPNQITIGNVTATSLRYVFDNDTVTNIYLGPIIRC